MKAMLLLLCAATPPAAAAEKIALFDFSIVNTSPAASTPDELARLRSLDRQLHDDLSHRYALVDMTPVQGEVARISSIRGCNGCELDMAHQVGAGLAAYGWVQKVSNLILNINLVIEDAATGHVVRADSVDIRGNTDESWRRGLKYLLEERLFRDL